MTLSSRNVERRQRVVGHVKSRIYICVSEEQLLYCSQVATLSS